MHGAQRKAPGWQESILPQMPSIAGYLVPWGGWAGCQGGRGQVRSTSSQPQVNLKSTSIPVECAGPVRLLLLACLLGGVTASAGENSGHMDTGHMGVFMCNPHTCHVASVITRWERTPYDQRTQWHSSLRLSCQKLENWGCMIREDTEAILCICNATSVRTKDP